MSNADAISNVLGSFGGQLGLVNTGMGAKNPDGTINVSSTAQGVAATVESQFALAGKSYGPVQIGIGVWGVYNVAQDVYSNYQSTGTLSITGAQAASLAGNTVNIGMGLTRSTPLGAVSGLVATVAEYGFNVSTASSAPTNAVASKNTNYSNEGRNYTKVNYGFGPGYRGAGFSDPRLGTHPSSTASAPTFSVNSSWTKPDYSLVTEANLPVAREALNNLAAEDAFSANYMASLSKSYDASGLTPEAFARTIAESAPKNIDALDAYASAYHAAQEASTPAPAPAPEPEPTPAPAPQYSGGGRSGSSGGGWGTGSGGSLRSSDGSAVGTRWPIVIDLDGDGVELRPLSNSSTYFDLDNDGFAERTAWAGADDGLLMIDLGADGKVTDVKEISFAEWTPEKDTDLQALAKVFDSNQDGVFDSRDERFAEFRIWKDANSNGAVDAGEMLTLQQAGITGMEAKVKEGTSLDLGEGTQVAGLFKVQKADGKTVEGADVAFAYRTAGVQRGQDAQGNAMVVLETGEVFKHRVLAGTERDVTLTDTTSDGVHWLGATGNDLANRIDASSTANDMVIDAGAGADTVLGGSGNDILRGGAGSDVIKGGKGDDVLVADGADALTNLDGGEGYDHLMMEDDTALNLVLDQINVEAVTTGADNDTLTGTKNEVDYAIASGAGADTVRTAGGNDFVAAGSGNDVVETGAGDDQLLGEDGNDTLKAGAGNDLLAGGRGNDVLDGGAGNDVYFFARGDGQDVINDLVPETYTYSVEVAYQYEAKVLKPSGKSATWVNEMRTGYRSETRQGERESNVDGGIDTLLFGAGITVEDLVLSTAGADMVVQLRDSVDENLISGDQVTVNDWADQKNRIENFAFGDGTKLDFSAVTQAQHGMAGHDILQGSAEGDFLSGGAGNDTILSGDGRDIAVAGSGDDLVEAGAGHDFVFGGSDNDQLKGMAGRDYLLGGAGNDHIEGGDEDDVLAGGDGADTLDGGMGKDLLLGGADTDVLKGGGGDDTYFYFRGDGRDEIFDHQEIQEQHQESTYMGQRYQRSGKSGRWVDEYRTETRTHTVQQDGGDDRLEFGLGINIDDLFIETRGNDLVVALREGATELGGLKDQVLIRDWSNAMNRVETFGLASGLQLDMAEVLHARSALDGNDTLTGTAGNDFLSSGAGNDQLQGFAGKDILVGGAGHDSLDGGEGDDDLHAGAGDDAVLAGTGNDYLYGGEGTDTLNGEEGSDVLVGGAGSDNLMGGLGNDTYIFNRGDGKDRIDETTTETVQESYTYTESVLKTNGGKWGDSSQVWVNETRTGYRSVTRQVDGGEDVLQFGWGIDVDDLLFSKAGADLVIDVQLNGLATDDQISIANWGATHSRVETIRFENGFGVEIADISSAQKGTAQADRLVAGTEATWLSAQAGDDDLMGSALNDVMHGGRGADKLQGGMGDDVYIFARGDGKDVISDTGSQAVGTDKQRPGGDKLMLGSDIAIDDIVLERQGNDMLIHVRTPDGREAALSTVSDQIRVQDWNTAQRRVELLQFVDGTDFDVSGVVNTYLGVSGQASAETLTGSSAADWINGFGGEDMISSSGGNDFVFGEAGHDTIDSGDGDDIVSGGAGNDVIHTGAGTDMITGGDGNDQLNGQAGNDLLFGGTGDDRIDGGDGDDYIVGDQGNDTYIASKGSDIYRFGVGDGQDTYIGSDASGIKGTDVIMLEDDISKDRLWFTRSGDDLVMQILGTQDQIRFQAWYSGSAPSRHVLGFDLGEEVLSFSKVNDLVNAMASFTPNDGSTAYGIRPEDLPQQVSTSMNSAWVKV